MAYSDEVDIIQKKYQLEVQRCQDLQAENEQYSEDMETLQDMYHDLRMKQHEMQETRPVQEEESPSVEFGVTSSTEEPSSLQPLVSQVPENMSMRKVHFPHLFLKGQNTGTKTLFSKLYNRVLTCLETNVLPV